MMLLIAITLNMKVKKIRKKRYQLKRYRISYFISSKDSDEIGTMHTKSNNTEIMIGNET